MEGLQEALDDAKGAKKQNHKQDAYLIKATAERS